MDRSHLQVAAVTGGAAMLGALLMSGVRAETPDPVVVSDLVPEVEFAPEAEGEEGGFKMGQGVPPASAPYRQPGEPFRAPTPGDKGKGDKGKDARGKPSKGKDAKGKKPKSKGKPKGKASNKKKKR